MVPFRPRAFLVLIMAVIFLAAGTIFMESQEKASQQQKDQSAISLANWQAAREKADYYSQQGDYIKALQYYLECIRQADGLNKKESAGWARNNAAYMIIKQHKQDPTTDLLPAKKLLEEALTIKEASDDCKLKLQSNLDYVKLFIKVT
ncbi:MAG: hypothetical protein JHC32_00865 [Candidatus Aminicenantes bacterium]|nr:hypothetical protein [Candidatus Aminicenantes bacterium]